MRGRSTKQKRARVRREEAVLLAECRRPPTRAWLDWAAQLEDRTGGLYTAGGAGQKNGKP